MYAILCLKEGNSSIPIPIVTERESMAVWKTLDEAKEFAANHILCQASVVLCIDLEYLEVIEL